MSLAVIFLPAILDGDGYRHLSFRGAADQAAPPRLSITQRVPEPVEQEPHTAVSRETIDVEDLSSGKSWFVHVADQKSIDHAGILIQTLAGDGYKATYRMVVGDGGQVFKVEVNAGQSEADARAVATNIRKKYGFQTTLMRR